MLNIRELGVFRGDRRILEAVSLEIAPGEICALMGLSGAGKSTLLRSIAALEPIDAGSIGVESFSLVPGPVPPETRLRELRRHVGMVFQAASLFEHITALENVMLAPIHALGWSRTRAEEVAHRLLESLGVAARANALPRQLSGGEAQRVAIARALAPGPNLLLMDEPTSALDPARRGALGQSLRALADEGRALLISTHDVEFARDFADRILVLDRGHIVEAGPAKSVLSAPSHQATRQLLQGDPRSPN